MATASDQILTVAQMQAAEQRIFDAGTSVEAVMERAGSGAADWVWRIAAGRPVTVLCGPGNNGGDGYVIARILLERGLNVQVIAPVQPKTDAARAMRKRLGTPVFTADGGGARGVLVDCLFGSGLSRPLSPELQLLLRDLAERHDTAIAVDLPSGVASDSGALLNSRLPRYDCTIALGAWKFAHWLQPSNAIMGVLRLVDIDVAPTEGAAALLSPPHIDPPGRTAHKYTRGMCAVVGGAMPGAAMLAAEAAQRAGAGYVKLHLASGGFPGRPDLVADSGPLDGFLDEPRLSSILIGPGLGRDKDASKALGLAIAADKPLVLDADALMILRAAHVREGWAAVATPHEGELATMCESFSVIAASKLDRARALARITGMVIIAKGADTLIAAPDGTVAIAPPASRWLSTAGSGDVLSGIAASRLAAGASPYEAACQAVWLHGRAAGELGAAFTTSELAKAVTSAMARSL